MKGGRQSHSRAEMKLSRSNSTLSKKSKPDLRQVVSRKDITAVTMNMSGRSGLGLTPRYKVDMVKE